MQLNSQESCSIPRRNNMDRTNACINLTEKLAQCQVRQAVPKDWLNRQTKQLYYKWQSHIPGNCGISVNPKRNARGVLAIVLWLQFFTPHSNTSLHLKESDRKSGGGVSVRNRVISSQTLLQV